MADRLDAAADELVPIGVRETHLGEPRLRSELRRTTFQLRMFADVVDDGAYLDVRIDHADPDWPMGAPRPDLRRILHPLGPVLVFAASNFPFAFSVAGGDTASALAAGCPVVVKAHPGHPELSAATADQVQQALATAGAPPGVLGLLFGTDAGVAALQAPQIKAASFTGSIAGGRALFDIASRRPEPIPFYGELGSVNPVFVTEAAAASRPDQIVSEFVASFTLGAGQFCTKPGVLLVPRDSAVVERLAEAELPGPAPLLYPRIQEGYVETLRGLAAQPAVSVLRSGDADADLGADPPSPTLLTTDGGGPAGRPAGGPRRGVPRMLRTHDARRGVRRRGRAAGGGRGDRRPAHRVDHRHATTTRWSPPLRDALALKAGRVLWNSWPTGVSVTYAQQHGGPYPATTAPTTTSVGTDAIARFLRPVAYQGFPQQLLPAALRDDSTLPRLVDGQRS